MVKLDHLAIFVTDEQRSARWYVEHLGLRIEFTVPERGTIALQDDGGMTLFLVRSPALPLRPSCVLTMQVDDVATTHAALVAAGVSFEQAPQKLAWGYGAELRDPDGYAVHLWDERSMREHGDA